MAKIASSLVVRKSIVVLINKIVMLQVIVILLYIGLRLSKLWLFQQIFSETDFHQINFWLGLMVFLILTVSQLVAIVALILEWQHEYYEARKDVIVHTRGVLKKKEDIYSLKTVEAGNVEQSLIGKFLNYGTIRIYSPVLNREYFLRDIPDPHHMRSSVISLLSDRDNNEAKIIPKGSAEISHTRSQPPHRPF